MPKMAIVSPTGEVEIKNLDDYESLSAAVGGYIELLKIEDDCHIYINEEGKNLNLPLNYKVNKLCKDLLPIGLAPDDYIVGPVIFFGAIDDEGNDLDVPDRIVRILEAMN